MVAKSGDAPVHHELRKRCNRRERCVSTRVLYIASVEHPIADNCIELPAKLG